MPSGPARPRDVVIRGLQVIDDAGHFLLADQPEAFLAALRVAFGDRRFSLGDRRFSVEGGPTVAWILPGRAAARSR